MIARLLAAALALLAALLLGWLLLQRRTSEEGPLPTIMPTKTLLATAAPSPLLPAGYRLAGTALGLHGRYAIFEDPAGSTEMYRVGDEIPGLGTLSTIGTTDAAVNTTGGEMLFKVRPAPTKVPENTRTVRRVRTPSPLPDLSEPESSPSDEPVPPVS